jgi:hypothetical protein
VKALNSNEYDRSPIGVLAKEGRRSCFLNFFSFDFSFCRRTCNSAAHMLAKLGAQSSVTGLFWEDSAPSCVKKNLVASDSAADV